MAILLAAVFFCIVNILLWIFFLSQYRKFFSTDEIIDSTRAELDRMIADINNNAGRNLDLIEDRINILRSLVAEADRHIQVAQQELDKQKNLSVFQQKIDSASYEGNLSRKVSESYRKNSARKTNIVESSYSNAPQVLQGQGFSERGYEGDLFHQIQNEKEIVSDAGTVFSVEKMESPVTKVSAVSPEVSYSDKIVQPKKTFTELVLDLTAAGHSVDEIASELGRTNTEVLLVLNMNS